jgi:hypothetical protein
MEDQPKEIEWNPNLEVYFKETGEKAIGLSWIHKKSEEYYSNRTIFLDLPTIIIGAVNGFISVGATKVFPGDDYASVYIGVVALFVSLLNTINSYFGWGRRAEAHKISSLSYAKLYRFLKIEMSLPRNERMKPSDLLKYVRTEYDRLAEISPLLPPQIIQQYNTKFGKHQEIKAPEETNGLDSIVIYEPTTASQAAM